MLTVAVEQDHMKDNVDIDIDAHSVSMASSERSFSKLKLEKNYLRFTMSQERLNGLATLCIEKRLLDEINIETITDDFASRNVRTIF